MADLEHIMSDDWWKDRDPRRIIDFDAAREEREGRTRAAEPIQLEDVPARLQDIAERLAQLSEEVEELLEILGGGPPAPPCG